MRTINVREVRKHLPLGAIKEIAEKLNIFAPVVSNILNGHAGSKYKNQVLELALDIILAKKESEKLATEKAELLGLTANEYLTIGPHKKKRVAEYKPSYAKLFGMSKEEREVYQKSKRSQVRFEDYAGFLTSEETAFLRYVDAIAKEQNISKPTVKGIKRMNQFGLLKYIEELGIVQNEQNEEDLKTLPDDQLRDIIYDIIQPLTGEEEEE
jgi:transcriptional regulator with XRE-family HTH domain